MNTKRESKMAIAALLALGFASVGCDDDYVEGSVDPAIHVCETANVAGTEITAGETQSTGPEVTIADVPYDVALPSGAMGYVTFETDEEASVFVFTEEAGVMHAVFHGEEEEEVAPTGSNRFCATEVAELFAVDLHEPGTYALQLGPTSTNIARIWLTESTSTGHHEEEPHTH